MFGMGPPPGTIPKKPIGLNNEEFDASNSD